MLLGSHVMSVNSWRHLSKTTILSKACLGHQLSGTGVGVGLEGVGFRRSSKIWGCRCSTCLGKGSRAQQEVGASTADEAHHIVGGLQVVPEANVLMVQHII